MEPASFEHDLATRYASRAMVAIFSPKTPDRDLAPHLACARGGRARSSGSRSRRRRSTPSGSTSTTPTSPAPPRSRRSSATTSWRTSTCCKEQCPEAGGILHLGATSCDVTDNADLIIQRRALELVGAKLRAVIRNLRDFAAREKGRPCVAFTHFQPAQLTTVGKRAALWLQDFLLDHEELEWVAGSLRFRGLKGATGTQDSFLKLFDGDARKVQELERKFAARSASTARSP